VPLLSPFKCTCFSISGSTSPSYRNVHFNTSIFFSCSCPDKRNFAFLPVFYSRFVSVELPAYDDFGLRRAVFGGRRILPVCGLPCSPPPPSSAGPVPSPQRPSLTCARAQSHSEEDPISFFVKCPRFRRLYGRGGRNPSRVSAALR
jgi:hypothetical protein